MKAIVTLTLSPSEFDKLKKIVRLAQNICAVETTDARQMHRPVVVIDKEQEQRIAELQSEALAIQHFLD